MTQDIQSAVFGGGCFWCIEPVFERLQGVTSVLPGYAGGRTADPTYNQVCSGDTGHAEVIKVEFDPSQISYRSLLAVFFGIHDPTTLNRQDHDHGTQYRSIILYATEDQRCEAEAFIDGLQGSHAFPNPIVTEVKPLDRFYPAESDHREYYKNNFEQPYCRFVINPKVEKFEKEFDDLLRGRK